MNFRAKNPDYDQELDFEKSQFCPISRNGENGRFVSWDFLGVIFKHCDSQDPFSINWATLGFPDICSLRIFLLEDMYQMFDLQVSTKIAVVKVTFFLYLWSIWIFAPKLLIFYFSKNVFLKKKFLVWFLGQNLDFWHENSIIWWNIQEYLPILTQKFK